MKRLNRVLAFLKNEEGASGIEYALIAAMVAVIIAGFVPTISTKISAIFDAILKAFG